MSSHASSEQLIQSHLDKEAAVGAAVAILRHGQIEYVGGFGVTSVEDGGLPVTPRTLFAYGSICKTLCAVLVMRLVEQERLDLDTPIATYLPDLPFSNPAYGAQITLRHLLSHTTGLAAAGKYWGPRDPDSLRRFVYEQIPHYAFLSRPGSVHLYNSTVICIAGYLAEVVTGKFYDDLMQEYVLDPLQMERVTYDPAVASTYPTALPHARDADGNLRVFHRMTYNASGNPSSFGLGSVSDLANLAQMILNQGKFEGQPFLSAASMAEMQKLHGSRPILGAAHPLAHTYNGYGLGLELGTYRDRRVARHGGMNLSFNCFFDLFPDEQTGVILLTNYCHEARLMDLVVELYDHALHLPYHGTVFLAPPVPSNVFPSHEQLQRYTGTVLRVETADLATFCIEQKAGEPGDNEDRVDTLVLHRQGRTHDLIPLGNDQFYAPIAERYRMTVTFVFNAEGAIAHVMIDGEPYHPVDLDQHLAPTLLLWQSFAGLYKDPTNASRDEIFRVWLQDGTLYVAEGAEEAPCNPLGERCFASELGLFEFEEAGPATANILVWGKSARFYPLDTDAYLNDGVIHFVVDIPAVQHRVTVGQRLQIISHT